MFLYRGFLESEQVLTLFCGFVDTCYVVCECETHYPNNSGGLNSIVAHYRHTDWSAGHLCVFQDGESPENNYRSKHSWNARFFNGEKNLVTWTHFMWKKFQRNGWTFIRVDSLDIDSLTTHIAQILNWFFVSASPKKSYVNTLILINPAFFWSLLLSFLYGKPKDREKKI